MAPAPKKRTNRSVQPVLKGPTSLNMGMRKRETERIEKDIKKLSLRLSPKFANDDEYEVLEFDE